ncbi:MAG: tyrosine-type recombinase/integrase [Pirellulaceae bacterium]
MDAPANYLATPQTGMVALDFENEAKGDDSILFWAKRYWEAEVDGSPEGTLRAKRADLQLFLSYFSTVVGSDLVDYWTPSVSKGFRSWLDNPAPAKPSRSHQERYAPSSINRMLATIRHFAKYIESTRRFEAGPPMKNIKDLDLQTPVWKGLSELELMRLRAALDQVTQLAGRKQQMPLRNRAVFILGLDTALRAFEIATLNYDQYQGKYLKRVKGKASIYADVYLSADARRELDQYIAQERGTQPGALFVTNRGGMMSRQQIDRFLKTVAAQANAKLPPDEQINLHAHMLRHTSTKRVYEKKGPVEAKEHGRHKSFKQLERYAAQTQQEREETVDNLWS